MQFWQPKPLTYWSRDMKNSSFGYYKKLSGLGLEEGEQKVAEALKKEGFGVLTKIDVKSTLKQKLDVDHRPYLILGACNPQLAHRALITDDSIGLLLPCNVVVAQADDGVEVSILKPEAMFAAVQIKGLESVAQEADARLRRVWESL
jgi:uncharacterized protein (DUF302 family)